MSGLCRRRGAGARAPGAKGARMEISQGVDLRRSPRSSQMGGDRTFGSSEPMTESRPLRPAPENEAVLESGRDAGEALSATMGSGTVVPAAGLLTPLDLPPKIHPAAFRARGLRRWARVEQRPIGGDGAEAPG